MDFKMRMSRLGYSLLKGYGRGVPVFGGLGIMIGGYEAYQEFNRQRRYLRYEYSGMTCAQKVSDASSGIVIGGIIGICLGGFLWPVSVPFYVAHQLERRSTKPWNCPIKD